jgi:hypothetical protein
MAPKFCSLQELFVSKYSSLASLKGQVVYVPYYYIDNENNIYFAVETNKTIGYITKASPYCYLTFAPFYMYIDVIDDEENNVQENNIKKKMSYTYGYGYSYGYGLPTESELTVDLLLEVIHEIRKPLNELFFAIHSNNYKLISSILSTLSLDIYAYSIIIYLINNITDLLQFNVELVRDILPKPVIQAFNKYGVEDVVLDYVW